MKKIQITKEKVVAIFTKWDEEYRKDPELYMNEISRLCKFTPKTYGENCAEYFMSLLNDLTK